MIGGYIDRESWDKTVLLRIKTNNQFEQNEVQRSLKYFNLISPVITLWKNTNFGGKENSLSMTFQWLICAITENPSFLCCVQFRLLQGGELCSLTIDIKFQPFFSFASPQR